MPRFAADKMLGRLARWLRIAGQDVAYGPHLSGAGLLREARATGRTILTRDERLMKTRNRPPAFFVSSDRFREQLVEVTAAFGIDPFTALFERCVECNTEVVSASPEAIRESVPAYVFETQERFVRCPKCDHVYWGATHADRVRRELEAMGFRPRDSEAPA